MLHKRNNSVITLAILLTLVGVSKPAKAFLLAQADAAKTTFNVPDKLPNNSNVKVSASNSTSNVNKSLTDGFTEKYSQAKVDIETQSSDDAINAVAAGKVDVASIGRNLTADEKSKGLVAVPISREKIAIVISKDNPYDGNLTISQFAQIFRGEITDWSEIGGAPGKIQLVDLPETNDTRQAFPNYPVFQEGEFVTGSNAVKVDQDSTDKMVAQLGESGIGYAVAGDVSERDDVKIVTMHQTQPDDERYPFSQPFNLVYQGTPSETTEAFLGYATTENGQKAIAGRVGSLSLASAAAIAPNVATDSPQVTPDGKDKVAADADPDGKDKVAADADPDGKDKVATDADPDGKDKTVVAEGGSLDSPDNNLKVDEGGEVNPELEGSGEVNSGLEDTGKINPDVEGSGEVNPELEGSGEINPDVEGSGEVNPELEGSGEAQPDAAIKGETPTASDNTTPDAADTDDNQGKAVAAKKNNWWWWIPLVLGIPLLGLVALKFLGGKGDQEPALSGVSTPDNPQGGGGDNDAFDPDLDENLSATGASAAAKMGNAGVNSVNTATKLGGAAIATGGAATAGFVGRQKDTTEEIELDQELNQNEVDLENRAAQPNADINQPIVEIPSDSVSEFSDQETKLQSTEQTTKLQTGDFDDPENPASGMFGKISQAGGAAMAGGAAAVGGVAASGFLKDRDKSNSSDLETSDSDFESETNRSGFDSSEDIGSGDIGVDKVSSTSSANEFRGDYVLNEEVAKEIGSNQDTDLDGDNSAIGGGATSNEWSTDSDSVTDIDTNFDTTEVELPENEVTEGQTPGKTSGFIDSTIDKANQAGGAAMAGGAAAVGGAAAAASGFFANRSVESEQTTDLDVNQIDSDSDDVEFSFDTSNEYATNVVADAEIDSETDLDAMTASEDVNLDEITFDDANTDTSTASLDEITFDDANTDTSTTSLDEITFDSADSSVNASLDEITFDDANNNSIDDLIDDIKTDGDRNSEINSGINSGINSEISLEEISLDSGVENNNPLSNKTADISDPSMSQSDDMDNISSWLDELGTPSESTEDISAWLNNLGNANSDNAQSSNAQTGNVQSNLPRENAVQSEGEAEDISFQFLEDLLDRDADSNQDQK